MTDRETKRQQVARTLGWTEEPSHIYSADVRINFTAWRSPDGKRLSPAPPSWGEDTPEGLDATLKLLDEVQMGIILHPPFGVRSEWKVELYDPSDMEIRALVLADHLPGAIFGAVWQALCGKEKRE